ncbi:MAG: M1 family metallopeptidase [Ignavibacterium sp.]|uniref:M1 family metallopeptidase n=1 Tax=Ignavibacterium sp. TaxID=2651167 RepID=UPI00404B695D
MKTKIIFVSIFLFALQIFSQTNYYIPRNVLKAYEKGTRSFDGKPGENYWQNSSDYKIKVQIDPKTRILTGSETIIYYNNSPDTLKEIVIRLYPNISKPSSKRDFNIPDDALTDGVKISSFRFNQNEMNPDDKNIFKFSGTNLRVILTDKIAPSSKAMIDISWSFEIPKTSFARMGTYDSTSFFIAYWYPQMAVYDDIDGWDYNEYTGYTEMYNDFSNFDVEITVPNGFHIWSTGVWQNPDEILSNEFLKRYEQAKNSDEVVRIFTTDDLTNKNRYKSSGDFHTFKFKADYVPDFAFGMSDHYLWDAVSYLTPDNKRVYIAAAYKESSKDFVDVAYYAKETIKYFSEELPAIPFPYPSCTVWNGSGGMEYPMIVNNGSSQTKEGTVGVTSHEIAHQYMPFYMGINERKYAFMDEGWAVMLPFDFQERMTEGAMPRERNAMGFEFVAGYDMEMPLLVPSNLLTGYSYRVSAYLRPGLAYDFLRDFLGKEKFLKALHLYMERWNGKHPIPWDFYFSINQAVGEDLLWYWKPWFFDFGYPDLAIKFYELKDGNLKVEVEKKGIIPVPIKISLMKNDEMVKEVYYTADVWKTGNSTFRITVDNVKEINKIVLGSPKIPDSIRDDNEVQIK